ncbi:hypothetical protein PLICRDRAFT_320213 [Plicaturopsis crispa FD-325 SS-3]|nr:hypothetical protein PLICRDRAFT_320213 [Plicaturopsis crispa FD-325 SS-3]
MPTGLYHATLNKAVTRSASSLPQEVLLCYATYIDDAVNSCVSDLGNVPATRSDRPSGLLDAPGPHSPLSIDLRPLRSFNVNQGFLVWLFFLYLYSVLLLSTVTRPIVALPFAAHFLNCCLFRRFGPLRSQPPFPRNDVCAVSTLRIPTTVHRALQ